MRLLIIADDFTGALDTGVQFANYDVKFKILANPSCDFSIISSDISIAVINANTRHLSAAESYRVIFDIVKDARNAGFSNFYKKVDSGLRGHIGAELSAVIDALNIQSLHFAPAYPKMNRITENGCQYINGKPLTQSIFAKDLFNPAFSDSVIEITKKQTDKKVILNSSEGDGIHIYDAVCDADLERVAREIGECGLIATAGCAGFASQIAKNLGFKEAVSRKPRIPFPLLVVCGSINPVSLKQIETVVAAGVPRISLALEQKTDPFWMNSQWYVDLAEKSIQMIKENGWCIIDVNGKDCIVTEKSTLLNDDEILRERIVSILGCLTKKIIDAELGTTIFSIGGDTLKAIIDALSVDEISTVSELDTGVVLNCVGYRDNLVYIISKSGGFGDENTVLSLLKKIKKES